MKKPNPVWIIVNKESGEIGPFDRVLYLKKRDANWSVASHGRVVKYVPAPTTKKRKAKRK